MAAIATMAMAPAAATARLPSRRRVTLPRQARSLSVRASVEVEQAGSSTGSLLPSEMYVATNRFNTKPGKGPSFEKRWATRKSRLAELDGFEFFTLLRRVDTEEGEEVDFNYMSLTLWSDKKSFNAWRSGEAFKEAHGGGTLFGFVDMLVSSTMTLQGPPKPAFWNGLLPIKNPDVAKPEVVGGWRQVAADGVNLLPAECYVTCNRFSIKSGFEEAFEKRWASRESKLLEMPGFQNFVLCRRNVGGKGHGADKGDEFNYMSLTVWENKAAFENWRTSKQFGKAHGSEEKKPDDKPDMSMFNGRPSVACYEGSLTIRA
uniref:ABM domain-containing protein n=1 Tax=Tetraselmis chuii TaxID=63592 RepID=A0A6U1HB29_9CHLO|mmetsp:Transcript_26665/g.47455  ORF Transcript_26665/g.47455 Transcript_26665/m.47455 type:complete len:317 (+) Transcript_26665:122-1072(+)